MDALRQCGIHITKWPGQDSPEKFLFGEAALVSPSLAEGFQGTLGSPVNEFTSVLQKLLITSNALRQCVIATCVDSTLEWIQPPLSTWD